MNEITYYHAHFYYEKESFMMAEKIYEKSSKLEEVFRGNFHKQKVGPHTLWSFQLGFTPTQLNKIIPWLILNRESLSVLIHPMTGNDLRDHTDYAMWLGEAVTLDLSVL